MIIGYSGAGKSTLAETLGKYYDVPVLHLDRINFLPGWVQRPAEDRDADHKTFLENNKQWVIDGDYSASLFTERLELADRIIILAYSRWACLKNVILRYRKFKNKIRSSVSDGCIEKLDWEFIRWVLRDGRKKTRNKRYQNIINDYPDKTFLFRNRKQLSEYMKNLGK